MLLSLPLPLSISSHPRNSSMESIRSPRTSDSLFPPATQSGSLPYGARVYELPCGAPLTTVEAVVVVAVALGSS